MLSELSDHENAPATASSQEKQAALQKTLAAFETLGQLVPFTGPSDISAQDTHDHLLSGKCLFYTSGTWMYSVGRDIDQNKVNRMIPAELPVFQPSRGTVGGYLPTWAVLKNAPHRDDAVELLLYIGGARSAEKWVRYTKNPTGLRGHLSMPDEPQDIWTQYQLDMSRKYDPHFFRDHPMTLVFGRNDAPSNLLFNKQLRLLLAGRTSLSNHKYGAQLNRFRHSLILKIVLAIIVLQGLVLTGLGFYLFYLFYHFDAQIDARVAGRLELPALLMEQDALNYDAVKNMSKLDTLLGERTVMAVVVTRAGTILHASDPALEGQPAASTLEERFMQHINQGEPETLRGRSEGTTPPYLEVLSPIRVKNVLVGYLYIQAETSLAETEKKQLLQQYVFSTAVGIILTSLGAAGLLYLLITPRIRRTLSCLARVGDGDLHARVPGKASADELGTLQEGVNSMLNELQSREQKRREADHRMRQSQQELDAFFIESPAGLAIVDNQLRYSKINPTLAEINGATVAEHIGRTAGQIMPDLAPVIEPMFREVLTAGKEYLNVQVNGETAAHPGVARQWMVSYFPMRGLDDRITSLGIVVIETTQRKQAEDALRASESDMAEAQRIAALGSFDGDMCSDELYWSKELYRIHFKDPETYTPTKQAFVELLYPDDRDAYLRKLQDSLATGRPLNAEYRIEAPDGSLRTLQTTAYVTRDEGENITGLRGAVQDITEPKRAE
ncbi:MAG: PAS domain-containing protein [Fuerstiella sp.]